MTKEMKQNIVTIIISIILVIIIFSVIYFIHNLIFKSYTYETDYSYICNTISCEYDNIKDLQKELKEAFQDDKNINNIVTNASRISSYGITAKDVKSSISVKRSGDIIKLKIKNKDAQKGFLILYGSHSLLSEYDLVELNTTFNKTPKYYNYFKFSLVTGSLLGLFLISCDISFINNKKNEKSNNEIEEEIY